jgi:hypothetical protein
MPGMPAGPGAAAGPTLGALAPAAANAGPLLPPMPTAIVDGKPPAVLAPAVFPGPTTWALPGVPAGALTDV